MNQTSNKATLDIVSLGLAFGITWALGMFVLGMAARLFGWGVPVVAVLSSVYVGYGPGLIGSLAGAAWGFADGFIGGVVMAWLYNKLISRNN